MSSRRGLLYNQISMRWFSIAAAVLAVIALFFGNCLSCPLMAAKHDCCHGNQRCHQGQPTAKLCEAQALQHFVQAAKEDGAAAFAVCGAPVALAANSHVAPDSVIAVVAEYAPPDLLSLHSSLRI